MLISCNNNQIISIRYDEHSKSAKKHAGTIMAITIKLVHS